MFNQNSFSIDSANNNSFNGAGTFGGIQNKKSLNQSDSYGNDEEYDFGFNLANYNFKDTNNPATTNPIKVEKVNSLKVQPRISKQHQFKKGPQKKYEQKTNNNYLQKISQKPSSIMSQDQRPRGLLKQKIKVDYTLETLKPTQSQITTSNKPSKKSQNNSEISKSDIFSANIFSCMDAPEYERDFQISPKVIARKYF